MWRKIIIVLLPLLGCHEPDRARGRWQGVVEMDEITVAFEVGGRIDDLAVGRGDLVTAGQVIAKLDDAIARRSREATAAEVEAIEAELALMRAGTRQEEVSATSARLIAARAVEKNLHDQQKRQETLVEEGALPAASVDALRTQHSQARGERQALEQQLRAQRNGARPEQITALEARLAAAEAAVASADERLARHVLHAPKAASVIDVHLEPGEIAGPGVAVATLGDIHHPHVEIFIPQAQLSQVSQGMKAEVEVDASSHPYQGHVEYIYPRTEFTPRYLFSEEERQTLVVRVRVAVADPEAALPIGVPAFVQLTGAAP
ncbi:MAG: HlyD family efflux transporter periplasmic adaptor subunit [Myxococcales bacterium]|nr:HlyD family efflux transporter periplasmic adaptor subunit [Myxococcales bacterium]